MTRDVLAMIVLGGLGSISGVVVGAIVLSIVNNYLLPDVLFDVPAKLGLGFNLSAISSGVYGAVLVIVVLLQPRGLARAHFWLPEPGMRVARGRNARILSRAVRSGAGARVSALWPLGVVGARCSVVDEATCLACALIMRWRAGGAAR